MKRGNFSISLHWPDLALVVSGVSLKSGPISVSLKKEKVTVRKERRLKRTIQSELCSLEKTSRRKCRTFLVGALWKRE